MTERTIFLAALEISDPATRAEYLDGACAGNETLRGQVESLLESHASAGAFLAHPAAEQLVADPGSTEQTVATDSADDEGDGSGESSPRLRGRRAETGRLAEKEADSLATRADPLLTGKTDDVDSEANDSGSSLSFLLPSRRADSMGRLAHYEVLAVVGKGSFGTVLKAFDEKLHRIVAIKVLAPELAASGSAKNRFIREARSAAAVRNEHVINIHAVDEQPIPYLVMEYIEGQTLDDKLKKVGVLEVKEILRIGYQIACGLTAAHNQGLIHRDIKPANILLENGVERVKITDFGLARAADDASITQSGFIAGTPQYMSPEQALGESLDHRSDLFSLGSVLYALCTGRPPFRASTTMAVLKRVCEDTPRPIAETNPEIPDWLAEIVDKLLAKSAGDRFQTAAEVSSRLQECLMSLQQTGRGPTSSLARPDRSGSADQVRRGVGAALPWLAGGGAVAMLLLANALANRWTKTGNDSRYVTGDQTRSELVNLTKWGTFVDPLGACSLDRAVNRATITVPGDRPYDLLPQPAYPVVYNRNAPRLLGEVDGDFRIQVAVPPFARPSAGTTSRPGGKVAYRSAGLLVWINEQTLLRFERAGHGEQHHGAPYSHAQWFVAGQSRGDEVEMLPDQPDGVTHLQIERQGAVLHLRKSADGRTWTDWRTVADLELPSRVSVGVTASSSTRGAFTAVFENLWIDPPISVAPASPAQAKADPGWMALFNGNDLQNWSKYGGSRGEWNVVDGILIGREGPSHLYMTKRKVGSFHLRTQAKISPEGSAGLCFGVGFPATATGEDWKPQGFEVHIAGTTNLQTTGSVESLRASSQLGGTQGTAINGDVWFGLELIAHNQRLVVKVDGKTTADVPGDFSAPGYLALHLKDTATTIHFARIEFKELARESQPPLDRRGVESGWTSLFNRKDLSGWKTHPDVETEWKVENGELIGQSGCLFSERDDYRDFHLRVEANINPGGNSGLMFRTEFGYGRTVEGKDWRVPLGYEADIADFSNNRTGGLHYAIKGSDQMKRIVVIDQIAPPDTWFTQEVIARGNHIIVRVNDREVVNHTDKSSSFEQGHLTLQILDPGTVIRFRKIEVKELTRSASDPSAAPPVAAGIQDTQGKAQNRITDYREIHDAERAAFDRWLEEMKDQEFIPLTLSVWNRDDKTPRFTAVSVHMGQSLPWEVRHVRNQTLEDSAANRKLVDDMVSRGFGLESRCVYLSNREHWSILLWHRRDSKHKFFTDNGSRDLVAGRLQEFRDKRVRNHPVQLSVSMAPNGTPWFSYLAWSGDSTPWHSELELTKADLMQRLEEYRGKGMTPVSLQGYRVGNELRFLVLFYGFPYAVNWTVDTSLTPEEYEQALQAHRQRGVRPIRVSQHAEKGQTRYAVVWAPYRTAPPAAVAPFDEKQAKAHQEAWARHLGVDVEITNAIGMKLRLIPPGRFVMGSTQAEIDTLLPQANEAQKRDLPTETPQRRVEIPDPFYLGQSEVTVGQFQAFVNETNYRTTAETNGKGGTSLVAGKREFSPEFTWRHTDATLSNDHPVVQISLRDASEFCAWLSKKDGRSYALPDEERWEFACRAGTTTRWFSGDISEALANFAWINSNSQGTTHPVGSKLPNAFGLLDMLGNAEELCKASGGGVVSRGGNATLLFTGVRCAARSRFDENVTYFRRGFRVAVVKIKEDLPTKTPVAPPFAVAPFGSTQAKTFQEAWAAHLGVGVESTNSIGMKLRLLPPGEFQMGATAQEIEELAPVFAAPAVKYVRSMAPAHKVRITKPAAIGVDEVTVGQFATFVSETGHVTLAEKEGSAGAPNELGQGTLQKGKTWREPGWSLSDDLPVVAVSWHDAVAFCEWLSKKEGRQYRLPTEAEWEYACRAGTTSLTGFGPTVNESQAVFGRGAAGKPEPVGGKRAGNAFGIRDMLGNVHEWCLDSYHEGYYQVSPAADPPGPHPGAERVLRGQAFDSPVQRCVSPYRFGRPPYYRAITIGFRVMLVDVLKPSNPLAKGIAE